MDDPLDALAPRLTAVFNQVLKHIDTTMAAQPRIEAKHFLILMDGVLLGGDRLLRALQEVVRERGWSGTDILPANMLWDIDTHLGWNACLVPFAPLGVTPREELTDCRDHFWQLLDAKVLKPPFFVFIEHLERFAFQDDKVLDQARKAFLAPLMRDFYTFPVFVISQARHFPDQPVDYLKGFPLSSATKTISLPVWSHDEISADNPPLGSLDESLRNEVLRLASGSPGIAAHLAQRVLEGNSLGNACRVVLTDLMQGYDGVTGQWPDYFQELSRIVVEKANQVDILDLPPGGVLGTDPLRRLVRLGVVEPNGAYHRVTAPFEQLLRGAQ